MVGTYQLLRCIHCIRDSSVRDIGVQLYVLKDKFSFSAPVILNGIQWSKKLDPIFKQNRKETSDLRWQYYCSADGFLRIYPGQKSIQIFFSSISFSVQMIISLDFSRWRIYPNSLNLQKRTAVVHSILCWQFYLECQFSKKYFRIKILG